MQNGMARGTFFLCLLQNLNASSKHCIQSHHNNIYNLAWKIKYFNSLDFEYRMLDELWGVQLIFE